MEPDELKVLKEYFLKAILEQESIRLKKELDPIQDQHSLLHGSRAFLLDGKPIWNGDAQAAKTKGKKPLHPDLQEEARRIVRQQNKLIVDQQRLVNVWGILTHYCHSMQDLRDMLPDIVVERMRPHEITGISRTREPGYALTSASPAKAKLYQDGLNIMFYYLANQLVF